MTHGVTLHTTSKHTLSHRHLLFLYPWRFSDLLQSLVTAKLLFQLESLLSLIYFATQICIQPLSSPSLAAR
ncbi:hypothetical protein Bca4012_018037 [Brassica carinata]